MLTDCTSLQNIYLNTTDSYIMVNDIDCTGHNFTTQLWGGTSFAGTFDGGNFSIFNLSVQTNVSSYVSLLGYGKNAQARNVVFKNVQLIACNNLLYVGALFGHCSNCIISNVHVTTTSPLILNTISCASEAGGVAGSLTACWMSNCTVQNTLVTVPNSYAGGLVGNVETSNLSFCYNLGNSNISQPIVYAGIQSAGGLVGGICLGNIFSSGVHQGVVQASAQAGGIAGCMTDSNLGQVYVLDYVSVVCPQQTGGIVGIAKFSSLLTPQLLNSFSRANLTCSCLCGGLLGELQQNTSVNFTLSNSYTSSYILGCSATTCGGLLGNSIYNDTPSFSDVFYNNETIAITPCGAQNLNGCAITLGFPCGQLYSQILETFDQGTIWGGNNLQVQYNFTYGTCNCSYGCAPPSTILPSTQTPSSLAPTSQMSSSDLVSTHYPSTMFPSTVFETSSPPSSSIHPLTCFYQVLNCQNCPQNAPLFDLKQGNVSCIFSSGEWRWTFTPNNGTLTNNGEIVVAG